jgi:outer membrane receptor protein involved in Fe transport
MTYLGSLTMNYTFDHITVTSVTGFYDFASTNWAPLSGTVSAFFAGTNDEWNQTFTQEVRAVTDFSGPINFTGGLYAQAEWRRFENTSLLGYTVADAEGRTYDDDDRFHTTENAYSAYGELRWKIINTVELAGGARWTTEIKNGTIENAYVNPADAGFLLAQGQVIDDHLSASAVNPQVTLMWKPTSELMLYAAYKTGFKSGGISNAIVVDNTFNSANTVFKPEYVKGEEAGLKWELYDRTFTGAIDIFRYNFTDLQYPSFNSATVSYIIQNAAVARTQGVEIQGAWQATPRFTLSTDLSFLDAEFVSFNNTTCYTGQTLAQGCGPAGQNISGYQVPDTPKFTGLFDATYKLPLFSTYTLRMDAEGIYKSGYFAAVTYSPWSYQSGFWLLNASLRLTRAGQPWEFAVIGKNLLKEAYFYAAGDLPAGAEGTTGFGIGDPRTVEMQVTYRF